MEIATIILTVLSVILLFLFINQLQKLKVTESELSESEIRYRGIQEKYKDVIDVDRIITSRNEEIRVMSQNIESLKVDFEKQKEKLNVDYINKRNIYETLLAEISVVEENL
jgi:cell division protein FtsI/penicillin-binding protein 2